MKYTCEFDALFQIVIMAIFCYLNSIFASMKPIDYIVDQSALIKLAQNLVKNIEDQYTANNFLKRLNDCGNDLTKKESCKAIKNVTHDLLSMAVYGFDESINFENGHTFVLDYEEREYQPYQNSTELTLKIGNSKSVLTESILVTEMYSGKDEAIMHLYKKMASRLMFYGLHSLINPKKAF